MIQSLSLAQFVGNALIFLGIAFVGFVILRSSLVKQRSSELADLAETRGETISDLEKKVDTMQLEIKVLQGQLQAYQSLKAEEIAIEVARLLKPTIDRIGNQ